MKRSEESLTVMESPLFENGDMPEKWRCLGKNQYLSRIVSPEAEMAE
jgi:hypothetical protein